MTTKSTSANGQQHQQEQEHHAKVNILDQVGQRPLGSPLRGFQERPQMASSVRETKLTKSVWTRSAKTKLQHQEPAAPPTTQIHRSVGFGGLTSNNALAEQNFGM